MQEKRTSVFENSLIWFGAAVSIAEIITGTYLAPLGFKRGLSAIIIGHIIGCALLFVSGLIGATVRKSAMESTKMTFGNMGGKLFALLNIIQLIGWTGIMIYDGAIAADGVWNTGSWIWCLVIGGLIILWIAVGIENLGRINTVAVTALFILTILLSFIIFNGHTAEFAVSDAMTFGAAVELSVAMPLSWLPLISDYTRQAKEPVKATAASAVTYGFVSCWMYIIGLGAALFTGESDIAQIMLKSGLGVAALLVVVVSTVTTTFLDAFSAGISAESLSDKIKGKYFAVMVTITGTAAAIFLPLGDITDFLYFIGSVFAPMIAVQIADFFVVKNNGSNNAVHIVNVISWFTGFVAYRVFMNFDFITGNTLPVMVITVLICVFINRIYVKFKIN